MKMYWTVVNCHNEHKINQILSNSILIFIYKNISGFRIWQRVDSIHWIGYEDPGCI